MDRNDGAPVVACSALLDRDVETSARVRQLKRTMTIMAYAHEKTIMAMQAAWIEWQHGRGAEAGMEWIENTLDGPDLLPEDDDPHATEAQAYFDAACERLEQWRREADAENAA